MSRLDMAKLFGEADGATYDRLSVANPRHAEDALLALTADANGAVLVVTFDGSASKRSAREGMAVFSPPEFIAFVATRLALPDSP